MNDSRTMRRTGRDRRDAGSYRRIRRADRERDLARSQARVLKDHGLVWNSVADATPSSVPAPMPVGLVSNGPAKASGLAPASNATGATASLRPAASSAAPIANAAAPKDRSWLPEIGETVVVADVRIDAVDVGGGSAPPFYVLARA